MFENLLIWLLEKLYPKQEEPAKPSVSVNVSQKQTVKKATNRTIKRTPVKKVAVKKTVKPKVKK
jgi:hypothetical protein